MLQEFFNIKYNTEYFHRLEVVFDKDLTSSTFSYSWLILFYLFESLDYIFLSIKNFK